jgi:hypothetical protein
MACILNQLEAYVNFIHIHGHSDHITTTAISPILAETDIATMADRFPSLDDFDAGTSSTIPSSASAIY